jgi:hypothetical protein
MDMQMEMSPQVSAFNSFLEIEVMDHITTPLLIIGATARLFSKVSSLL